MLLRNYCCFHNTSRDEISADSFGLAEVLRRDTVLSREPHQEKENAETVENKQGIEDRDETVC